MSQDADTVSTDLAAVATSTPEALAALRMRYQMRAQAARENLAAIDAAILEHMEAAGVTALVVSDSLELRAVVDRTTKCANNEETCDSLFTAVEGDIKRFSACLSSTAFLPGACRHELDPVEFDRLFTVTVKTRLEGKPVRKIAVVNPKMIPQGATNHD